MKNRFFIGVLAVFMMNAQPMMAQDAAKGRQKARTCVNCHGALGLAQLPNAPNLAGESAIYTSGQLKAFRDGRRVHEQMSIVAQGLSDDDIADLAAWYEAIEVEVTEPELD